MNIEEKYREIGKAVIDEVMARADERCITITLRSVQFVEKVFIRMEDIPEPISVWTYNDLIDISETNRHQRIREHSEAEERQGKEELEVEWGHEKGERVEDGEI